MEPKKRIVQEKLKDFLGDLGAKKSAPGGGSAAALSGALGISLVQMVANFSVYPVKSPGTYGGGAAKPLFNRANSPQIREILQKTRQIKKELIKLIDEDAKAVSAFFQKENSFSKRRRAKQRMKNIPVKIFQNCEEGLKLIPYLAKKGNKNLLNDLRIARILLKAGAKAAKELTEMSN
ncbi:MAG: cyclodeaminase/cyclohydrolase family protein [Candidatus Omnitrophica bacterium]|nr:cyclodeaminase/cyclohydrolase family protein [Candidatus Omnitrophota bacterium]